MLKSKLNGRNMVQAINTWKVSALRFSAAFIELTREELKEMHKASHPGDSVCRLNLPRKEGGRGLIAVEDCIGIAKLGLESYLSQSDERLVITGTSSESEEGFKLRMKMERKSEWATFEANGEYS